MTRIERYYIAPLYRINITPIDHRCYRLAQDQRTKNSLKSFRQAIRLDATIHVECTASHLLCVITLKHKKHSDLDRE
jgi:hypothetical protein